ncbi:MAG: DUF4163 domain-containing protein [Owenweeksia sp.]|nr:DUF4163 domain-containing protein [Owenweeksia sp.]
MRYIHFAFVVLVLHALLSCQNPAEAPTSTSPEDGTDSLSYSIEVLEQEGPCTDTQRLICLDIHIESMRIKAGASPAVKRHVETYLTQQINTTDNVEQTAQNPTEVADNLQEEYGRILKEMDNYQLPWQYERRLKVYFNQEPLFGVELYAQSYTGGAHPVSFQYFYLFDTQNGAPLKWTKLIQKSHHGSLREQAEEMFRKQQEIKEGQGYEEAGYWFDNEQFYLPDNFRYSKEGLSFLYNPYEDRPMVRRQHPLGL